MTPGAVAGVPRWILRLEGLAVLVVSLLLYRQFGGGWGLLALCFLLPDLSMLGYLAGPRVGATLYNLAHSYIAPIVGARAPCRGRHRRLAFPRVRGCKT